MAQLVYNCFCSLTLVNLYTQVYCHQCFAQYVAETLPQCSENNIILQTCK